MGKIEQITFTKTFAVFACLAVNKIKPRRAQSLRRFLAVSASSDI